MPTETTITKLREMRLSVMASALKDQMADSQFQNMAFEDRLGLLVDAEWNARKNNHLQKLIRQATFSELGACLENVEYLPDRNLKREDLLRFGTCGYIQEHHNIILLGAAGSGKTYLACALGMAAVRQFLTVKYIRLPDLLVGFNIARGNGSIRKLLAQYKKYSLLIIDEWLLYPLKETEVRDLLGRQGTRGLLRSCVPSLTFRAGERSSPIRSWQTQSVTALSMTPTPLSLAARSPCGRGKACRKPEVRACGSPGSARTRGFTHSGFPGE